jgi:molybdopterin converting factor small subunit
VGTDAAPDAAQGPETNDRGPLDREIDENQAVTVLFFAAAREASGTARTVLPAAGATVAQLLAGLASTHGDQLKKVLPSCSIWVNRSPAPPGYVLRGGDELALMPPVSGGCAAVPSIDG